jgi:acetyltransferase-like isoleucine patch superfamily enzyme
LILAIRSRSGADHESARSSRPPGPLSIGRDVSITNGTCIAASGNGIEIGDDCLISPNVTILSANYRHSELDRPIRQQGMTSKGVKIGNNVWLEAGVVVLDGAVIRDGTIVAPNSVVSSRLPANTIAQGNPARVIFTRRLFCIDSSRGSQ